MQVFDNAVYGIDISADLIQRTPAECKSFVNGTEGALVPGAIPGKPQQQASCLAGWPDWPLFIGLELLSHLSNPCRANIDAASRLCPSRLLQKRKQPVRSYTNRLLLVMVYGRPIYWP